MEYVITASAIVALMWLMLHTWPEDDGAGAEHLSGDEHEARTP